MSSSPSSSELIPVRLKSDRNGNYDSRDVSMRTRWRYSRDGGAEIHVALANGRAKK